MQRKKSGEQIPIFHQKISISEKKDHNKDIAHLVQRSKKQTKYSVTFYAISLKHY